MSNADIHPELRRVARFVPRQIVFRRSLPILRKLQNLRKPNNSGIEVLTLPCGVGVRLHRPARTAGPAPALLWIHGGGYVIGNAAQDDDFCRALTRKLGIVVAVLLVLAVEPLLLLVEVVLLLPRHQVMVLTLLNLLQVLQEFLPLVL
jgi:hypothetical protein